MSVEKQLRDIIREIVRSELNSANISKHYYGVVISVAPDNGTASIRLAGESVEVTMPNKTGEQIVVGDYVVIMAINGKLSNGVIIIKF